MHKGQDAKQLRANYPHVDFVDHAIVKVAGIVKPNAIYDPSYGTLVDATTMAGAELAWEDAAVHSYAFFLRDNVTHATGWTPLIADSKGIDELDFN
jgi:hypothetical protein